MDKFGQALHSHTYSIECWKLRCTHANNLTVWSTAGKCARRLDKLSPTKSFKKLVTDQRLLCHHCSMGIAESNCSKGCCCSTWTRPVANPPVNMDHRNSYTLSLTDKINMGVTNQSLPVTVDELFGNTSSEAINTTEHHVVSWSFYIEVSHFYYLHLWVLVG